MNPANLVPGEKYLYSPNVPAKLFCSLEQKRSPQVLTYLHESPYEADYHVFFDQRGKTFNVCLKGYIVKEQIEPIFNIHE